MKYAVWRRVSRRAPLSGELDHNPARRIAVLRSVLQRLVNPRRIGMTCGRIPLRSVGLFSEMRTRDERLVEVLRIFDDRRDREPFGAKVEMAIEVFRHRRVL